MQFYHIQVCAVLKGSSYGTGYRLGLYLQQYVDYFAVACTVEGVWMRDFGIRIPILVFNPCVESFDKIIHYGLEPTIYSMRMLELLIEKANCQEKVVHVHLEFETGFTRHGFRFNQIDEILVLLREKSRPRINFKNIELHHVLSLFIKNNLRTKLRT